MQSSFAAYLLVHYVFVSPVPIYQSCTLDSLQGGRLEGSDSTTSIYACLFASPKADVTSNQALIHPPACASDPLGH